LRVSLTGFKRVIAPGRLKGRPIWAAFSFAAGWQELLAVSIPCPGFPAQVGCTDVYSDSETDLARQE